MLKQKTTTPKIYCGCMQNLSTKKCSKESPLLQGFQITLSVIFLEINNICDYKYKIHGSNSQFFKGGKEVLLYSDGRNLFEIDRCYFSISAKCEMAGKIQKIKKFFRGIREVVFSAWGGGGGAKFERNSSISYK